MDKERIELIETYRAEAIALLTTNQQARVAAQRTTATIFAVAGAVIVAGIVARTDDVAIALPAVVLLLLSVLFQQYADVTVMGAARAALERRVAANLGDYGLIYETAVAPIRKRPPLVQSMRVLQTVTSVFVGTVVVVGTVIAFQDQPSAVQIGFTTLTLLSLASAALSYRDMLRSGPVASAELEATLTRLRS
jgi:hypothetical protein